MDAEEGKGQDGQNEVENVEKFFILPFHLVFPLCLFINVQLVFPVSFCPSDLETGRSSWSSTSRASHPTGAALKGQQDSSPVSAWSDLQ